MEDKTIILEGQLIHAKYYERIIVYSMFYPYKKIGFYIIENANDTLFNILSNKSICNVNGIDYYISSNKSNNTLKLIEKEGRDEGITLISEKGELYDRFKIWRLFRIN